MNFKGAWLSTSIDLTPQLLGPFSPNLQDMFMGVPETSSESFVQNQPLGGATNQTIHHTIHQKMFVQSILDSQDTFHTNLNHVCKTI